MRRTAYRFPSILFCTYPTMTSKSIPVTPIAAGIKESAAVAPDCLSQSSAKCETCNGHGLVGSQTHYEPDRASEPCPDCAFPQAVADGHYLLKQIVNALPTRRDWLDPAIERAARALLSAQPAAEATDSEEDAFVIDKLAKLLAGVCIALKGPELELHRHSYHDIVEVAEAIKLELDLYRAQAAVEPTLSPAQAIHYPECWDTAAYPTLASAIKEIGAFKCSTDECPAAQPQEAKAVAAGAQEFQYLCMAWGETEFPEVKLVSTLAEAREVIIGFCWEPASEAPADQRDGMQTDFDEQIEQEGYYQTTFEAGGLSVKKVVLHRAAAPQEPARPSNREKMLEQLVQAYGPKSLQYDIEHPCDGLNSTMPAQPAGAVPVDELIGHLLPVDESGNISAQIRINGVGYAFSGCKDVGTDWRYPAIPLYTRQADSSEVKAHFYTRISKWRNAFDAMHQRAM